MFHLRYQRFKVGVSGIAPVTVTPGVENVDLSGLVEQVGEMTTCFILHSIFSSPHYFPQHVDYCHKMKEILTLLDLTNCSGAPVTVEEEEVDCSLQQV